MTPLLSRRVSTTFSLSRMDYSPPTLTIRWDSHRNLPVSVRTIATHNDRSGTHKVVEKMTQHCTRAVPSTFRSFPTEESRIRFIITASPPNVLYGVTLPPTHPLQREREIHHGISHPSFLLLSLKKNNGILAHSCSGASISCGFF